MKRWLLLWCLPVLFVDGGEALAKRPAPRGRVPLMPEVAYADSEVPRYSSLTVAGEKPRSGGGAVGWGVELGLAGQGNSSASDVLGLQLLWGGRLFARIPVSSKIFLKPSLGYFRKAERAGGSGLTQQAYEAGVTGYYALARTPRLRWLAGLTQRLDLLRSTIVTPGASGDSPLAWRYRAGPAMGIAYGLNPGMSLVADWELTLGGVKPVRVFSGVSAGVMFYFP